MRLLLLVLAMQAALGLELFVDVLATSDQPDGSIERPFKAVNDAIVSGPEPDLTVTVLSAPSTFSIDSLGQRQDLLIACAESTLLLQTQITVGPASSLTFVDCGVTVDNTANLPVSVAVLGKLKILSSSFFDFETRIVMLIGALEVSDSVFTNNAASIITSAGFGFQLSINNCTFENNFGPAGAVFAMKIQTSYSPADTSITVLNSKFRNNFSAMGGSIMVLYATATNAFLLNSSKSIVFEDCEFSNNPGYAFVIYSKEIVWNFTRVAFSSHDYLIVISLYSGKLLLQDFSAGKTGIVVALSYLSGELTGRNITLNGVTKGPALYFNNRGSAQKALISLSQLNITQFTSPVTSLVSGTIVAMSVTLNLTDFKIWSGFSLVGAVGLFSTSVVSMMNAEVFDTKGVSFGMILGVFSTIQGKNFNLHGIRQDKIGWIALFTCGFAFENLKFSNLSSTPNMGFGGGINPYVAMTFLASFSSTGSMKKTTLILPNVISSMPFYLSSSNVTIEDLVVPLVRCDLVDTLNSAAYIRDVTIGRIEYSSLFYFALSSYVELTRMSLQGGSLSSCVIVVAAGTRMDGSYLSITNTQYRALVLGTNGIMHLEHIRLNNVLSDCLIPDVIKSEVDMIDVVVENSSFDLVNINTGKVYFQYCELRNHTVLKSFISINNATLTLDSVLITNISLGASQVLVSASKASTFLMLQSSLSGVTSTNYELFEISQSELIVLSSVISFFEGTLVRASRSSVEVVGSTIQGGGLKDSMEKKRWVTAGFLKCDSCVGVTIDESSFRELRGNTGGVLSVYGEQSRLAFVKVTNSEFSRCHSEENGGAFELYWTLLTVAGSNFTGNNAVQGGAIFLDSDATVKATITNSNFFNNTANEGGAVRWTNTRPKYSSVISKDNRAVYGNFEATLPHHLALNTSALVVEGVGGTLGTTSVVILIKDILNQTVATENTTNVQIESENANASIQGGTAVSAVQGVIDFSSIIVYAAPGTVILSRAYTTRQGALPDFNFSYSVRKCKAGELATSTGCAPCPKNTYSLDPDGVSCHFCHVGATCLGGADIVLDSGYWRSSNLSDEIFMCVHSNACEGGPNALCGDQYKGRLCADCSDGSFKIGTGYCSPCRHPGVHWMAVAVILLGIMTYIGGFVWLSVAGRSGRKRDMYLSILRNRIHYFHILLAFNLIYIDWSYSVALLLYVFEAFSSITTSLWVSPCVIDFGLAMVYVRAIAASLLPFVLIALSVLIFIIWDRFSHSWSVYHVSVQVQLILVYVCYPFALKSGLELVSCVIMETDSLWLRADLDIKCWEFDHYRMVLIVFLPVMILYGLGVPLLFLGWYVRVRNSPRKYLIRFLLAGYREECNYWELIFIALKSFLLCSVSLLAGISVKTQFVVLTMGLYIFISQLFFQEPFEDAGISFISKLSVALQVVMCLFGYFRSPLAKSAYEEVAQLLEALILLIQCGQIAVSIFLLIKTFLRKVPNAMTIYPITSSIECSDSIQLPNPNPSYNSSFVLS